MNNRPTTTRTLNPLHFEDLEPHRFEDLVRQLAYDFRSWKLIEATGRLGSDDGIDIRGIEASIDANADISLEEGDSVADQPLPDDRVWVIQCKREKSISPGRMKQMVADSLPAGGDAPHGFILAAACDFSKKARDQFQQESVARGVQEFYIWGKADLEDMLFLPKYDHLLFAYFNISLQVRRRSIKTQLRGRLALKRKLISVLGEIRKEHFESVLLRDPTEDCYPRADHIVDFSLRPRWKYYTFLSHGRPDHLAFISSSFYAYVSDDGKQWDALLDLATLTPAPPELKYVNAPTHDELRKRANYWNCWSKIPQKNQAWLNEVRLLHYDRILAVDEDGDCCHEGPHLLVEFGDEGPAFEPEVFQRINFGSGYYHDLQPTSENRVKFFPDIVPDFLDEGVQPIAK
jgi:hypothetical protein